MSKWATTSLGALAESVEYGVTASAVHQPVGPKFLRITDIQDGAVNWETVPWCECDARSSVNSRLEPGDIVFVRTGATTGKSYLISKCPDDAVFASYLIRVRVGNTVDPRYISCFFQTPDYWSQINRSTRGVAQPGVNATTLKQLVIPLPPLPEQRRIAAILDQAEALRAKRRQALAKLDVLTQSLFLEMFGDPVTNPKEWELVKLGNELHLQGGYAFKSDDFFRSGIRVVKITNVHRDSLIWSEDVDYISPAVFNHFEAYSLTEGDIVIALTRPIIKSLSSVKIAIIQLSDTPCLLNQRVGRFIFHTSSRILPPYLFEYCHTKIFFNAVQRFCSVSLQPNMSTTQVENLEILCPPLALQQAFGCSVTNIETLKTTHRTALTKLDALFASLQHRAFRGEL